MVTMVTMVGRANSLAEVPDVSVGTLTTFDSVLIALAVVGGVAGALRGAAAQLFGLSGAVLGLVTGMAMVPTVAPTLVDGPGTGLATLTLGLLVGGTVIGQLLGAALGSRARAWVHRQGASGPDRIAGAAVGVGAYMLALWLLGAALLSGPIPSLSAFVTNSRVVAVVSRSLPPPPDLVGRMAVYLDRQGLPQVYTGPAGFVAAPSVEPPEDAAVAAAAEAGRDATVQVSAVGCGGVSLGSGVVTDDGIITTNAHVVAGTDRVTVRDAGGEHEAVPVLFDPRVDLAVLAADGLHATPLPWSDEGLDRNSTGAVLGYPGGQQELMVSGASVRSRVRATGRDIYGEGAVERQVLALAAGRRTRRFRRTVRHG